jgi:cytochrome c oxidase assembly protein subunit 11
VRSGAPARVCGDASRFAPSVQGGAEPSACAGYGGTTQRVDSVEDKIARHAAAPAEEVAAAAARDITVTFNADVSDALPWRFRPSQRAVVVRPGESVLAFYTATNLSSEPITGVSTYNVTPARAGLYFNKVQCFCFEEQRLLPGETLDMPVFFYIDPEYAKDDKLKGINLLTLSYTFFKTDHVLDEEEQAMAAAHAQQKERYSSLASSAAAAAAAAAAPLPAAAVPLGGAAAAAALAHQA